MPKSCPRCSADNVDDARYCRLCGVAFSAVPVTEPPADPPAPSKWHMSANRAPWIVFGALALTVSTGIGWWLHVAPTRGAPTFDSAPPPSVLDAAQNPGRSASPAAPAPSVQGPAVTTSPATEPPAARLPATSSTATPPTSDAKPVPSSRPDLNDTAPARTQAVTAPGRFGERLSSGIGAPSAPGSGPTTTPNRAHAEAAARETQARALPPTSAPPAARVTKEAGPGRGATVRERCSGQNALLTGICEARQCMRAEHAGEAVCQRIKAAEDRRREQ